MMRTKQVIVGYDFSNVGDVALDWALRYVTTTAADLHVVLAVDESHRVEEGGDGPVDFAYTERLYEVLGNRLADRCVSILDQAEIEYALHVRIGKPTEEVLAVAREAGADLIVVGSHGKSGLRRMVQGSVSETVVRGAECPVMVVRPKTYESVQRQLMRPVADGTVPPPFTAEAQEKHRTPHRRPHIYSYENSIVIKRPSDWPLR